MSMHSSFRIPSQRRARAHSGQLRASARKRERQVLRERELAALAAEKGISVHTLQRQLFAVVEQSYRHAEAERLRLQKATAAYLARSRQQYGSGYY